MVVHDLDSHIHLGAWTNWSRGAILGRTLTITRFHGNLLIAFTAAFVAYVAVRFWRILCVGLHRGYSTRDPRPTYHHQRQVILRNSPSPESGLWSLLCLSYAWRRRGKVPIPRVFGVGAALSLTVFTIGAFGLAGVFSSSVASDMGNIVLLRGNNCGHTARPSLGVSDNSVAIANSRRLAGQVDTAFNYAQECYNTVDGVGLVDCGRFVQPRISFQSDNDAPCPFAEGICYNGDEGGNLQLDTGHIDMTEHLGWNTPKKDSVSQRNVVTCAPLVTDGFKSTYFDSENNATLVRYHYGGYVTTNADSTDGVDVGGFTWQAASVNDQYRALQYRDNPRFPNSNYGVMEAWSVTIDGQPNAKLSRFEPIPELSKADSDVSIIFLSGNGVMSNQVVDDGWYRLTQPFHPEGSETTYYQPEEAASPLACATQYQFCNLNIPGDAGCGPLASYTDAVYGAALKAFNATREDLSKPSTEVVTGNRDFDRLQWAITATSGRYLNVVQYLGARLLAAQSSLSSGIQNVDAEARPDWQLDVRNWFTTTLASVQASTLETVVPSFNPRGHEILDSLWKGPETRFQRDMCNSQTIKSDKHTSFSLFGIAFMYAIGFFIIILSMVLEPVLSSLYKRYGYKEYQEVEWNTNNALQLHRLTQETMGYGFDEEKGRGWERCDMEIPVTSPDVCLGALDLTDPEHPVVMDRKRSTLDGENQGDGDEEKGEESKGGYRAQVDSVRSSDADTASRGSSVEDEGILHQAGYEAAVHNLLPMYERL